MNKYNCLIAEDNIVDRRILEHFIGKINSLNAPLICCDGEEASSQLQSEDTDIVFSDIDMPNLSGISLLKTLKKPPVFIFITGHSEYALESFSLNVVDFILKPLVFNRFEKAVERAVELIELKKYSQKKDLPDGPVDKSTDTYFFIKENNAITKLYYSNILYIESLGDFSKLYTVQNTRFLTLVSLKSLHAQLPKSIFRRIHKQFIVNINHVLTISGNLIVMNNTQSLPLGPNYKQGLIDQVVTKKIISRFCT